MTVSFDGVICRCRLVVKTVYQNEDTDRWMVCFIGVADLDRFGTGLR